MYEEGFVLYQEKAFFFQCLVQQYTAILILDKMFVDNHLNKITQNILMGFSVSAKCLKLVQTYISSHFGDINTRITYCDDFMTLSNTQRESKPYPAKRNSNTKSCSGSRVQCLVFRFFFIRLMKKQLFIMLLLFYNL